MAKFLKGFELNSELEKLINEAETSLILISPYFKLHNKFKASLKSKIENPYLRITILFGKNENDKSKSLSIDDYNFLKQFSNIEIRYESRLHAKYYANQDNAILTSMNMYDFSQDNNIETGILLKGGTFHNIANNLITSAIGGDNLDQQAWQYFYEVIVQSEVILIKESIWENSLFGLRSKFIESKTKIDRFEELIELEKLNDKKSRIVNLSKDIDHLHSNQSKATEEFEKPLFNEGFCIRTGKTIPFNHKMPFTEEAYKSWSTYKNKDYPEKYCHFSGESSNGETSYNKPILMKHWNKAKLLLKK